MTGGAARVNRFPDWLFDVEEGVSCHQAQDHAEEKLDRVGHGHQHGKVAKDKIQPEQEDGGQAFQASAKKKW